MKIEHCRIHQVCNPDCEICQIDLMQEIQNKVRRIRGVRFSVKELNKNCKNPDLEKDKRIVLQAALLGLIGDSVHLSFCLNGKFLSDENFNKAKEICKGVWFPDTATAKENFLMDYNSKD